MEKTNFGFLLLSIVGSYFGLPCINADPPNNIPEPAVINQTDPLYKGFLEYTSNILEAQNFKKYNPCENFVEYTCEKYPHDSPLWHLVSVNMAIITKGMKSEQKTVFGKKVKAAFDACVKKRSNFAETHKNGQTLVDIVNKVEESIKIPFPVFSQQSVAATTEELSSILGFFSLNYDVSALIKQEIQGKKMVISAPELNYPEVYYQEQFDEFKEGYVASIADYVMLFAEYSGKNLDKKVFMNDITAVVELEKAIADAVNTESSPHSVLSVSGLHQSVDFINIGSFLEAISPMPVSSLTDHTFEVIVKNPAKLKKLDEFFKNNQVDSRVIYNMIYFKLLRSLKNLYPQKPSESVANEWLRQGFGLEQNGIFPQQPKQDLHPSELDDHTEVERSCAAEMADTYRFAAERIYVDTMLPSKELKKDFVHKVSVILVKVINGFRFQLDQLNWMSRESKKEAYRKLDKMLYNAVYDNWIDNDQLLNDMYDKASFEDVDAETQRLNNMRFNKEIQWRQLFQQNGKMNFTQTILTVNAWYMPEENHFFLPLAILQPPLFSVDYPLSTQYASVGYLIGHEMTHGFDTAGVTFDADGNKNTWLDKQSQAGFNKMAQCVIDQYTAFPHHGKGKQTQTEDIADNGGLRAAWNAFQAQQALHGTQPRLPHNELKELTHEQLFFIGFAHTWCTKDKPYPPSWDSHSPRYYRIMGTLQNTPAFQGAYNCPIGSEYAPKNHCDVWASEVKSNFK